MQIVNVTIIFKKCGYFDDLELIVFNTLQLCFHLTLNATIENTNLIAIRLQKNFITLLNWHKVLTNHWKHVRLDLIREQILVHEGKQFHSFETNIMMQGYIYAIGHMFIWNAPYLIVLSFAAICSTAMFYSFKLNSRL